MAFAQKKVRKFFPKKGPEKKALMFLSNVSRIKKENRKSIYKKVLKSKNLNERKVLIKARRTFSSRKKIFNSFQVLVNDYRKKYPSFQGVIIFGGVVKKESNPTDLDFVFIGALPENAKKDFCNILCSKTNIPVNPFPVKIDVLSNPKIFNELLSIPYLHFPKEWTVQNFVGPIEIKRKLQKSYNLALKEIARKKGLK